MTLANAPIGIVPINFANDDLHLGRTAMLPDNLVIEGLFDADVTATVLAAKR